MRTLPYCIILMVCSGITIHLFAVAHAPSYCIKYYFVCSFILFSCLLIRTRHHILYYWYVVVYYQFVCLYVHTITLYNIIIDMYSCIPFTCLLLDVCTMIYAIILFVWVSRIPFTCLLLCACHHIMEHYLCVVVITIILVHLFAKSHGPPYLIILLYVAVYYSLVCLYARTVVFYNIILYVVV